MDLIGYGSVVRALLPLLPTHTPTLTLTSIYTRSMGGIVAPDPAHPIPLSALLPSHTLPPRETWDPSWVETHSVEETLSLSPGSIMLENTSLDAHTGEPAASHIRMAFEHGKDVVTANKGPIATQYAGLAALAHDKGRILAFESVVMDGTPVFNLVAKTLPHTRVLKVEGILNSTSNHVLACLEDGGSVEDAIAHAQENGFAEADPSDDIDGRDAAAKIAALVNVFGYPSGISLHPDDIPADSIRDVTQKDLLSAVQSGSRLKVLASATLDHDSGTVDASVRLTPIPLSNPLAHVSSASSALTITTDLMGELTITETNPTILQTAYGELYDLLHILDLRSNDDAAHDDADA